MTARQMVHRFAFQVRTALSMWWGVVAAVAFGVLVTRGFFVDLRAGGADLARITVAAALTALLAARLVRRIRPAVEPHADLLSPWMEAGRDLELGLLVVVATHMLMQLAGGLTSPAYPIFYAMATFLVAYNRAWVGAVLVATSLALEALILQQAGQLHSSLGLLASHVAFAVFFGTVSLVLLRVEVSNLRREHRERLDAEIASRLQKAREYRFIAAPLSSGDGRSREQQEQHLYTSAVESIHQAHYITLSLLKGTLDARACALLWLDERGDYLSLRNVATDGGRETLQWAPFPALAGACGAVIKHRTAISALEPGGRAIPYYLGGVAVGAFLGVPVMESGHLRGVMCLDREEPERFGARERQLLEDAAEQLMVTVQTERMFCAVERTKYEQERFFKASEMLNSALGLEKVYETAFVAARQIVGFEYGAITLYDDKTRRHTVASVTGEPLSGFAGLSYADNAGLVAMAIKNLHHLPAGGELRDRSQVIFTRKMVVSGVSSLVVFPLILGDRALGAFVLADRKRGLFTADRREMLGVIANQVAVSVQNGKMYKQMEDMATTDGLTGLVNHRTFQERFDEMLARAERADKPVSLLLTDIDHFKSVNDTYGHPVGDAVLREVAGVLGEQARAVDVVARYGGEEFALVLEDTDRKGALILAERIREQVAALKHPSDQGPFSCTLSLGVASYPVDGTHKKLLVERADQALYHAKEHGRNQTVCFADLG